MRVDQLDRQTVRDVAVRRFSIDRMVDEYLAVYRHAIAEYHRQRSCGSLNVVTDFGAPRG
jgi:hypothetical protein